MKEVTCWPLSYKQNFILSTLWVEVTTEPIFSPQKQAIAFIDFWQDLTDLSHLAAFLGVDLAHKAQSIRFSQQISLTVTKPASSLPKLK